MRVLKVLLGIVGALALIFVVLGMIGPKDFTVKRSVAIEAPSDVIYKHISSFEKMDAWSPWAKLDPEMVSTIDGTDGTVGAKNSWEGNDQVGKGSQTFTKMEANKRVETHLHFTAPQESEADAYLEIGDDNNVTWGLTGEFGFVERVMFNFMSMDDMVGPSYEEGLAALKKNVEADYATILAEKAAAEAAAAAAAAEGEEETTEEGVN